MKPMSETMSRVYVLLFSLALCALVHVPAWAESPHGLEPADDMPYIPDLGGLRSQSFKNHYGQSRQLSEAVVLRQSTIENGTATIPAGGLYYISEVMDEVRPLMRDPFFILGEQAYLLKLHAGKRTVSDLSLKKGQKVLIDEAGYRVWFDYVTDHYQKPYAQLTLISPAGHWPLEFPLATVFKDMHEVKDLTMAAGENGQLRDFYLDKTYHYGASEFTAKEVTFDTVSFERIEYPVIDEATFSFSRPWTLDLRQEDYRWYFDKRIYAFRRPSGFLVRVTDWSGSTVLGEKLVRPSTPQGYKDREDEQDEYSLTIPAEDMHVEIMINPEYLKNSDFAPTGSDVPYGWQDGTLSLVVYSDLITLKNGRPWPLDNRYKVGLEANLMTGKLQRMVLENAAPFTLSNDHPTCLGPTKFSHVWNRPAFRVVAGGFSDKTVHDLYLRDAFYQRTDNMVFNTAKGRKDVDFFVGRAPTLMPILEDTFLTRLADSTYSTVVEGSHFSSYPRVLSDAAFNAPDRSAPFEARLKGFEREVIKNRKGDKLTAAEGLVIRNSYVDYRNNRIVIPPSGLYYTSRNSRNVRALSGESFYFLGKKAYLATFASTTVVGKNLDLDFWKNQPSGDENPIFWQDLPLGVHNKVIRYTGHTYLDDRSMAMVNIVKYSGNNFGAPFLMAQGFDAKDKDRRYMLPGLFAEGSTWILPEFIGQNYVRIEEVGTPLMKEFSFTYDEPAPAALAAGESARLGGFSLEVGAVDAQAGTVAVSLKDPAGKEVAAKVLGPLNAETSAVLPQFQDTVHSLQLLHDTVMVEMDLGQPFAEGKAKLWLYTGVTTYATDTPLPSDPRFVIRPDVCGHCYQLNELLLDNPEPIVLDMEHPTYEGPKDSDGRPMFTIVLDDFDGEMILGWHIETTVKGRTFKTKNLAFNPRSNIDALIGVNGSIEGFLRGSMLERMAYNEYWRLAQHPPVHRGLAARHALRLQ
jgi:hypothetical protein